MSVLSQRVGTEQKEPDSITVTAGALSAELVGGNLRAIRYRGHEVLRAIAYLVRDKDWGTYSPNLSNLTVDQQLSGFNVLYRAVCTDEQSPQNLTYEAHITGSSDGYISFSVTAAPDTPFLTARCGFAILHPLDGVSGRSAQVEHVDGSTQDFVFPELIAPWQPLTEIRAITHEIAPGVSACCRMEGDVFEMEDQRNWSDASYKTYVRPLSLPWPYTMEPGIQNKQSVELQILDPEIGKAHPAITSKHLAIKIEIGEEDGVFPGIGLSISPAQITDALTHPSLLQDLRPQLLLFHFDPTQGHGQRELSEFAEIARQSQASFPCELSLELPLPCRSDIREELREIAAQIAGAGIPLSSMMLGPDADRRSTPPGSEWPACPPLEEIYQAAREIFPTLYLGGGALTFFTELNRKRPPVDLLDYVSHCTCSIVHAADDRSVMQTLESLPYIVRSTRAFIGEKKRYRIGPSTIAMRLNPYGSRLMENPDHSRRVMTMNDTRQEALFAAAWMIGYVAATAMGHLDTLTVGSLTGPLGLASANSGAAIKHPTFHVAKGLAELGCNPRYVCRASEPARATAVAGSLHTGEMIVWVANLTCEEQQLVLPSCGTVHSLAILDERDSRTLREISTPPITAGNLVFELLPYGIARLVVERRTN